MSRIESGDARRVAKDARFAELAGDIHIQYFGDGHVGVLGFAVRRLVQPGAVLIRGYRAASWRAQIGRVQIRPGSVRAATLKVGTERSD